MIYIKFLLERVTILMSLKIVFVKDGGGKFRRKIIQ
jgi:hypothetical protein